MSLFGSLNLPPKTAVNLLIGAGALVLFLLLGMVPKQQHLGELSDQIDQAKFEIEQQNTLWPLYEKIQEIAAAGGAQAPQVPARELLNQEQVSHVTDTLAQIIVSTGLEAESVAPDPSSLGKGSKALSVTIRVKGEMDRFRQLLTELAALPSFVNVQTVRISQSPTKKEYTVTVWLAAG